MSSIEGDEANLGVTVLCTGKMFEEVSKPTDTSSHSGMGDAGSKSRVEPDNDDIFHPADLVVGRLSCSIKVEISVA